MIDSEKKFQRHCSWQIGPVEFVSSLAPSWSYQFRQQFQGFIQFDPNSTMAPRRTSNASSKATSVRMDKLKEHSAKTQNATVALTLEKLLEHLKSRPGVASHILTMLECGAYDEVDQPQDSGDFLPRSCNKFNLLSREAVMGLMGFLMPSYKEWFGGLPKTSKKECVLALCFLVHVAPDSALPTKSVTGLQEWCKQRYEQYGSRLGLRGDAPGRDQGSLREWFEDHGCSFWSVSAQSQTIKFVCGDSAQPLPEELKKLGVDTLVIENGLEVYNATIGCGCLKIKIADLFDVKTLDMPWWRKEVPQPHGQFGQDSQETPPRTPTTTTTASGTPRSTPTASPRTNGSVPPPEGSGDAFLGEINGWAEQGGKGQQLRGEVRWQGFYSHWQVVSDVIRRKWSNTWCYTVL